MLGKTARRIYEDERRRICGLVELTNKAGCGGILRNNKGEWRGGFVNNIGACPPIQAEAWAMLRGIQVAAQQGCKKVIFECDSKDIVEFMNKNTRSSTATHNILTACKEELFRIEV